MKRTALRLILWATLAALLLCAMPPARADEGVSPGVFVFHTPVFAGRADGYQTYYGLMNSDGKVLVKARYDWGRELRPGDPNVQTLFSLTTYDDGETNAHLYDASGKLVAKGYTYFEQLPSGYLLAGLPDSENEYRVLDKDGAPLKELPAWHDFSENNEGFIGKTSGAPECDAYFYDRDWKLIKKLRVQEILPYVYDDNTALFPVKIGGLWGYADARGEVAIKPMYEGVSFFVETGYASVDTKGGLTLIDKTGKTALNKTYQDIGQGGGFISLTTSSDCILFNADLMPLTKGGAYTYFRLPYYGGDYAFGSKAEGTFDAIGRDGKAIPLPGELLDHSEGGKVLVMQPGNGNEYYGIVRLADLATGKETELGKGYAYFTDKGDILLMNDEDATQLFSPEGQKIASYENISAMPDGRYLVRAKRFGAYRYGLIDREGSLLLPPEYRSLMYDDESGYYLAQRGGEQGYVDASGEWLVREKVSPPRTLED